jgi:uncharacterized protein involved in exopolysaccharide biosynthesis
VYRLADLRRVFVLAAAVASVTLIAKFVQDRTYTSRATFTAQGRRASSGAITLAQQLGVTVGGVDPTTGSQFQADFLLSDQVLSLVLAHPLKTSATSGGVTDSASLEQRWTGRKTVTPEKRDALVRKLRGSVRALVNPKTSVVGLAVTSTEPNVAQATCALLLAMLDSLNQASLAGQAAEERRFFAERSRDLAGQVEASEQVLQEFLTKNRPPFTSSPQLSLRFEAIQRDVVLRRQVYVAMLQLAEQAKIESMRNTPAIIVFGKPTTPAVPAARNLVLTVAAAFVLSFGVGLVTLTIWQSSGMPRSVRQFLNQRELSG